MSAAQWDAGAAAVAETRKCRNCGEVGHIARNCSAAKKVDNRDCRVCGQIGHIARNCPSKPADEYAGAAPVVSDKPRRPRTSGLAGKRCFNCGQNGHLSADCTVAAGNTACYSCQQIGHQSKDCPNK